MGSPLRNKTLSTKELRASLASVVKRVQRGERITLLHRSRPVLQLVPLEGVPDTSPLESDPLYGAGPLGRSTDGLSSDDHDAVLYGSAASPRLGGSKRR